jgi:uncharacterized membrane protein
MCKADAAAVNSRGLSHWRLDVTWGAFVTALSAISGLLIADWLAPKV